MAVTNPETFKLHGGALNTGTTDQHTSVVNRLAEIGLTGTYASGVVTITNAGLAVATNGTRVWRELCDICDSVNATLVYVAAT